MIHHKVSFRQSLVFIILCVIYVPEVTAQTINLTCQTENDGFLGLDRKNWNGGSTDAHSEGSLHNFDLPLNTFGDCKKISNISIEINAINADISNLPADCPPPGAYYYNISSPCADLTPASCDVANLIAEPNSGAFISQSLSFNSPPENFQFGDNLAIDIVPVMDVNCTNGQSALSSMSIILDYEICVTVTIIDDTPSMVVNLGPDEESCAGSTVELDAGPFSTYQWGPNGEVTPTIDAGPGTYSVTVTDFNGCSSTDEIEVTPYPTSDINFNPASPVVCDDDLIAVSVIENYSDYQWSNTASGQTVMLTSGTYDVTITDINNCTAVNSITVSSTNPPNPGTDNFIEVCNDGSTYNIEALLGTHDAGGMWIDNDFSGIDINSNPTATDFANVPSSIYTFSYIVEGVAPCNDEEATITVDVNQNNFAGLSNFYSDCQDPGFIDFINLLSGPDLGGSWDDIDGTGVDLSDPTAVDLNGIASGTYEFEYTVQTNTFCPEDNATLTISILDGVNAGLDNDITLCEGSTINLNSLISPDGDQGGDFTDPASTGSLTGSTVNTMGYAGETLIFNYEVGDINSDCGVDDAVFTITVESSLSAGDDANIELCLIDIINLDNYLTNADAGGNYNDENGSGGLDGNMLDTESIAPGQYTYTYVIGDGTTCPFDTSYIAIDFRPVPEANFETDTVQLCYEVCEVVNVTLDGLGPFTFDLISENTNGDQQSTSITTLNNNYPIYLCNDQSETSFSNDTLSFNGIDSLVLHLQNLESADCSSPITDSIFITTLPENVFNLDTAICIFDTLIINDIELYFGNSIYIDTLDAVNCDSIININVSFDEVDTSYIFETICIEDSINIFSTWFNQDYAYEEFTMETESGCDSLIIVDISFHPNTDTLINSTLCVGDSLIVNGNTYNELNPTGIELLVDASVNGCDSLVMIDLQFDNGINISRMDTLCSGESIIIGGVEFNASNSSDTLIIPGTECDTIIEIDLTFLESTINNIDGTFCANFDTIVNGVLYDINNPLGNETLPSGNHLGCDSLIFIDLSFYPNSENDINTTICANDSIVINGNVYNENNPIGQEILPNGSQFGCDSIININISIFESYDLTQDISLCDGDSIFLMGAWQFDSGIYLDTLSADNGCDSIVTSNVTYSPCIIDIQLYTVGNECTDGSQGTIGLNILSEIQLPYTIVLEQISNMNETVIEVTSEIENYEFNNLVTDNYIVTILDIDNTILYNNTIEIIDLNPSLEGTWMLLDTINCNGDLGEIEFIVTGGMPAYNYAWNENTLGDMSTISQLAPGEYAVTVSDENGCTINSSYILTEPNPITFDYIITDSSCNGSSDASVEITDIQGGSSPYNIYFNGELVVSNTIDSISDGNQLIEIVDDNFCNTQENITIESTAETQLAIYPLVYNINFGDTITFDGELLEDNLIFSWTTNSDISCIDCPFPTVAPLTNSTYLVSITNNSGCQQEVIIQVNIITEEINTTFPNIFSPNQDGVNDEFILQFPNGQTSQLELIIYDRWGSQIYQSISTENSIVWDGTNNGSALSTGVYIYQLIIDYPDGTQDIIVNDLTVIK